MKYTFTVTDVSRTVIVSALVAYGFPNLAEVVANQIDDPADDGPEVAILSVDGAGWGS